MRIDRKQYTHTHAGSRWRIRVLDEPGDIVIIIGYIDGLKEKNVLRCDKSGHEQYHIHGVPDMDTRVVIPDALSREQKTEKGFKAISVLAKAGVIKIGDDVLSEKDIWQEIKQNVLLK